MFNFVNDYKVAPLPPIFYDKKIYMKKKSKYNMFNFGNDYKVPPPPFFWCQIRKKNVILYLCKYGSW